MREITIPKPDVHHDTAQIDAEPVSIKLTLSDKLRELLEEMIMSGELLPGVKINESDLTQKFQVSRTPMREAIKALVATGLLEVRSRQGVWVAAVPIPKLMEMFEIMAILEGQCAKYAARRAMPAEVEKMLAIQALLEEKLKTGDAQTFYNVNALFHDALYAASHTQFIAEQTRFLRKRLSMYRKHATYLPGRMAATIQEHASIISAIQAKDSKGAMAAAQDHVNLLGDDMTDFIAKLPPTLSINH
jgi:DNA-binding GntR family transcriptional regulator